MLKKTNPFKFQKLTKAYTTNWKALGTPGYIPCCEISLSDINIATSAYFSSVLFIFSLVTSLCLYVKGAFLIETFCVIYTNVIGLVLNLPICYLFSICSIVLCSFFLLYLLKKKLVVFCFIHDCVLETPVFLS